VKRGNYSIIFGRNEDVDEKKKDIFRKRGKPTNDISMGMGEL